jgi:hypothetical protein
MYELSSGGKRKHIPVERFPEQRKLFEQRCVLGEVKKFVATPSNESDGHDERMKKYESRADQNLPLFEEG